MRAAFLAALLVAAGCAPCKDACRAEARQFEACLGAWGLEWADVGAADRADYRQRCVADVDVFTDSLPVDERATEDGACRELVDALRVATDCDAAWQALVEYGADP